MLFFKCMLNVIFLMVGMSFIVPTQAALPGSADGRLPLDVLAYRDVIGRALQRLPFVSAMAQEGNFKEQVKSVFVDASTGRFKLCDPYDARVKIALGQLGALVWQQYSPAVELLAHLYGHGIAVERAPFVANQLQLYAQMLKEMVRPMILVPPVASVGAEVTSTDVVQNASLIAGAASICAEEGVDTSDAAVESEDTIAKDDVGKPAWQQKKKKKTQTSPLSPEYKQYLSTLPEADLINKFAQAVKEKKSLVVLKMWHEACSRKIQHALEKRLKRNKTKDVFDTMYVDDTLNKLQKAIANRDESEMDAGIVALIERFAKSSVAHGARLDLAQLLLTGQSEAFGGMLHFKIDLDKVEKILESGFNNCSNPEHAGCAAHMLAGVMQLRYYSEQNLALKNQYKKKMVEYLELAVRHGNSEAHNLLQIRRLPDLRNKAINLCNNRQYSEALEVAESIVALWQEIESLAATGEHKAVQEEDTIPEDFKINVVKVIDLCRMHLGKLEASAASVAVPGSADGLADVAASLEFLPRLDLINAFSDAVRGGDLLCILDLYNEAISRDEANKKASKKNENTYKKALMKRLEQDGTLFAFQKMYIDYTAQDFCNAQSANDKQDCLDGLLEIFVDSPVDHPVRFDVAQLYMEGKGEGIFDGVTSSTNFQQAKYLLLPALESKNQQYEGEAAFLLMMTEQYEQNQNPALKDEQKIREYLNHAVRCGHRQAIALQNFQIGSGLVKKEKYEEALPLLQGILEFPLFGRTDLVSSVIAKCELHIQKKADMVKNATLLVKYAEKYLENAEKTKNAENAEKLVKLMNRFVESLLHADTPETIVMACEQAIERVHAEKMLLKQLSLDDADRRKRKILELIQNDLMVFVHQKNSEGGPAGDE